ncbi:MAG: DUF309 domain-containing protein [Geminocystis sp.]|nr:DUF309 domain-containing protein [Geminocystis sp.]MCS7148800.1 DUF309 domain-containing protein [Geminocystis sp.]MDW8115362.1 DUF309 domain-containing protein [Geminocystis sp.]MDW8462904.1 DUF309 domain-containing protein [Geminocystis sp.]HIK38301.1 DUF309 domain-containing protein [Geminocystis sp. M7585_C2015_104]
MTPLERAIEEFNQGKYYQCHDTLEAIWMEAVEPDKTFYQGILQIAVACYHLNRNNWRGAVMLLGEGTRKLREYEPEYMQIAVDELVRQSCELLMALQNMSQGDGRVADGQQKGKDNLRLPTIRLVNQ